MIRRGTIVAALAVLVSTLTTAPALAGEKIDVVIEVVVKVEAGGDVAAVAATGEGFVVGPVIASRGVYQLGQTVAVDVKDVEKKSDDEAKDWAKDLEKIESVSWAEPVWQEEPEDMRFHAWPEDGYDATSLLDNDARFAFMGLDTVHETSTGAGVVVAVLDTGFDTSHPLLAGRLLPGFDLVDDDADPSDEGDGLDNDGDGHADEAFGHGTFVSGVVLQIAPDAAILPLRVLDADGRAEIPTVVEGIYMAIENGADVINLSFGLASNEKPDTLKDAIKAAKDQGVLVVAAAGNLAADVKSYPASEGSVISVGAVGYGEDEEMANFSSHGKWVVLAAPGVDIVSAVPGGEYATWAGTSMAAPIVAGQAALLVQVDPEAKRSDVEKALRDTARKMKGKNKAEKGVIDLQESLIAML